MKIIVKQGIRHIITGGFADLVDIGIFNLLFWFFPFQTLAKVASFLVAATIKYFGNKYWAFRALRSLGEVGEKSNIREVARFLTITLIGLLINVASFSLFVKINPGLSLQLWREISVIFAILVTAIWNFCGYKFLVFKK